MWEKLTHRGPKAFERLCQLLAENECHDALSILKPNTYAGSFISLSEKQNMTKYDPNTTTDGKCFSYMKSNLEKDKLIPYTQTHSFTFNATVKKSSEFGKNPLLGTYSMESKNRGVLLLVNIMNFRDAKYQRKGSEKDCNDIIALFQEMNFKIFFYQDIDRDVSCFMFRYLNIYFTDTLLYSQRMHSILNLLINSEYLRHTDCFVFCLMSHGTIFRDTLVTQIEFTDGTYETSERLIKKFANQKCVSLVGKPKIFIFPVCRGDVPDRERHINRGEVISHDGPVPILGLPNTYPTFSDMIICYATVPGKLFPIKSKCFQKSLNLESLLGFRVHRGAETGSWYIQILVKVFAEHAANYSIEDLIKKVDQDVKKYRNDNGDMQTACYENRGFSKALYFNVGLFTDKK